MLEAIKRANIYNKSKGVKYLLFFLLIVLNFVIRLPSIPHEKGYDSFFIHSLANSISIFGSAEWWVHWLSVFGFYAYSYASAVPFILSGMHQLMGIEMEMVILIYCISIGIISIFTAYVLAGRLFPNFSFKYGVALFFSIAPGVMLFSTWEVSTRGLFIVLLPLFIFLLLSEINILKKLLLLIPLFIFQFAIHHYAFVLIPIMFVYLGILVLEKTNYLEMIKPYYHYIIIFLVIAFIGLPFLSRSLIDSGSRYSWLITSAITIIRQVGPVVILAAGSFIYLLLKKEKSRSDLLLLTMLTLFIPTIYSHTYGAFMLLLFIVLFIGLAFANVASMADTKRHISLVLIAIILMSVIFAGYFNHSRTGESDAYWYMGHDTYVAGIWGREYVPSGSYGLDTALETGRMFAVSEGHPITPTQSAANLAYGFIDESKIEYVRVSYLEKAFYFEGPYLVKSGTTVAGKMEWIRQTGSIDDLGSFNYFVQDKYYFKPIVNVVSQHYNKVYDGPRIAIWNS
ncbi:hypothetical protein [Methanolobus psychrotolerans]|uniref:hypothetical protein n=1 Tax=Methanolobus psychrotolerans TaxID=1874706 RepID=UPI001A92F39C|nr:hypothetical protein [Methanolobus psychrotolerans]